MDSDPELLERLGAAKAFVESFSSPVSASPTAAPAAPPAPTPGVNPELIDTKVEVIEHILRLQTQMGVPAGGKKLLKSKLERMKRDDLNRLLGSMSESAIKVLQSGEPIAPPPKPTVQAVVNESGQTVATTVAPVPMIMSKEQAGSSLYQVNLLLIKVLELSSVNFKEQLGGHVEGLTDDVLKCRKELEDILGEIYVAHGPKIDPYISPIAKYSLFMITLTSQRVMANKAKEKKEEPTLPPPRYPSPLPSSASGAGHTPT